MSQENNSPGIAFGLGAFIIWGLIPIFFKALSHVQTLEFLGHRMIWSFIFLVFLLFFRRTVPQLIKEIGQVLKNKKLLLMLLLSALLISSNWLVYIWAIANDQVIQASLGYFINPLMTITLGMAVLGERLSRAKQLSVGLAALGVLYMIIKGGEFPWIAMYLATSFALYALVRKKAQIGSVMGLWVEMLVMLPGAVGYLIYFNLTAQPATIAHDDFTWFMLVISGAVTTIPLVLFTSAAQRLPLSTIGVLQYLAPSITLFLAVFLWNEPFTFTHAVAFGCIWGALVIYSLDSFLPSRQKITNQ